MRYWVIYENGKFTVVDTYRHTRLDSYEKSETAEMVAELFNNINILGNAYDNTEDDRK